jgi:hypothetical protein
MRTYKDAFKNMTIYVVCTKDKWNLMTQVFMFSNKKNYSCHLVHS